MRQLLQKLRNGIHALNLRRDANSERYHTTNFLLTALFPLFIVCLAEITQDKYPSKFILFCAERSSVMLFNLLIASLIFYALLLLMKRAWRAVLFQSLVYMTLSVVELFKFGTNGNHLILSDMALAANVKSISSFAYIQITPQLVVYVLLMLGYIGATFWLNPQNKVRFPRRMVTGGLCLLSCVAIIVVPPISNSVYAFFDVDTSEADNAFQLNEKFDKNSFLAFLVQTTSAQLADRVQEPDDYGQDAIDALLHTDVKDPAVDVQPNVIVVMSEAFADFRKFDSLSIPQSTYAGFDAVAREGYRGTTIVPTYASFTVRTEFELLFGLPVRSLHDPNMPQTLLPDRAQPTLVRNYKDMGYDTAYVHPFVSSFYDRDKIYANFGFDKMLFIDDFTVDTNYYGAYVDDDTVFRQITDLIEDTDAPLYVHTTTMQNHQPYNQGEDPDAEFENYLTWIGTTSDALRDFTNQLKTIDEPTLILFVGDHFPSLKGEDSVYTQLGLNGDNCAVLYEQSYVLWSNYKLSYGEVPKEKISTFYLPYVLMDLAGSPHTAFTQTMLDKMEKLPIYSTNYLPDAAYDTDLDMLTYDRVLGEQLSAEGLPESKK